jgi:hypothetical protein
MCAGWNIWCTEQCPFQSRSSPCGSARREAAHFEVGVPDHHLVERDAHLVAGPAAEVLVGEEQDLLARAKAHSAIVPAFDEVHTMPPWAPQKALRSAAELM